MSATFTWNIKKLGAYPEYMGETDVVVDINWLCTGTQIENGKTYTSEEFGLTQVTFHGGQSFIPYSQLTEQTILGWVFESVGQPFIDYIQNTIQTSINNKLTPVVVNPVLPWVINIKQQPYSQYVQVGTNVTFSVVAESGAPFTYQWKKDNVDIPGEVANLYTINNVTSSDAGVYTVYLVSAQTSVTSDGATLNVGTEPFPQGAPN